MSLSSRSFSFLTIQFRLLHCKAHLIIICLLANVQCHIRIQFLRVVCWFHHATRDTSLFDWLTGWLTDQCSTYCAMRFNMNTVAAWLNHWLNVNKRIIIFYWINISALINWFSKSTGVFLSMLRLLPMTYNLKILQYERMTWTTKACERWNKKIKNKREKHRITIMIKARYRRVGEWVSSRGAFCSRIRFIHLFVCALCLLFGYFL